MHPVQETTPIRESKCILLHTYGIVSDIPSCVQTAATFLHTARKHHGSHLAYGLHNCADPLSQWDQVCVDGHVSRVVPLEIIDLSVRDVLVAAVFLDQT